MPSDGNNGKDSTKPMDIRVQRPTSRKAIIEWSPVTHASTYMVVIKDPLTLQGEWTFHVPADYCVLTVPMSLIPGHTYQVVLKAQKMRYKQGMVLYQTIRQSTMKFRAEFTKAEINALYERALKYVSNNENSPFDRIEWLYRNKPEEYFDYIYDKRHGVMEGYLKDDNGDPASIINGKINGLFFATNLDRRTRKPPTTSLFGGRRFYVPAAGLLFDDSVRLYFADFYCNFQAHYVTLVLTIEGSDTDKFCRENLIAVDLYNNAFLFKRFPEVFVTRRIHVEVFYTENVNLPDWINQHGAHFDNVEVSKGTSTPGGLPKNPQCNLCNLYSISQDSDDEIN